MTYLPDSKKTGVSETRTPAWRPSAPRPSESSGQGTGCRSQSTHCTSCPFHQTSLSEAGPCGVAQTGLRTQRPQPHLRPPQPLFPKPNPVIEYTR